MNSISFFLEVGSVRHFAATSVSRGLVEQLLEDAVWAPNHRLREPWRFIYADGEAKRKLSEAIDGNKQPALADILTQSPAVLIVTSKLNSDEHASREDFAAACCLIQNFRLLAWAHELGLSWELGDYSGCPQLLAQAGIQADERIAGILGLGHIETSPSSETPVSPPLFTLETW